ncbi:MMPL family transporter [Arsenophonus nasoniae]|uniref:MMPL family transporter n=1 Tax=Arsenophonus nasoniae TaxID=638 RepID=A0AA95K7H3_9GAMM|nr:MMPL family transporter [Arsenophonus nasoniae]WGL95373.1 MMPL family transporter [Arsenophonus nasoniae]
MKTPVLPIKFLYWGAVIWLLICLLLIALLALLPNVRFSDNILTWLPQKNLNHSSPSLNNDFILPDERQLLWLISPGKQPDSSVAEHWLALLRLEPGISFVKGPIDTQRQKQLEGSILSHCRKDEQLPREPVLQNHNNAHAQWIFSQIYDVLSDNHKNSLIDPLILMPNTWQKLAQNTSQLCLQNGWIIIQDYQGQYWYLIYGELIDSSFNMHSIDQLVTNLETKAKQFTADYPQAQVLSRGTMLYSDYKSQQIKEDIFTFGIIAVLAMGSLILVVFRSFRSLLLCFLSIGIGALVASITTLFVFGELYLITLVMNISIIGLSVDYSLYYLTERMVYGHQADPWQSLRKIQATLLLVLITTVTAYIIMMFTPFPEICQMIFFATVGFIGSYLTVVFWFPWLCRGIPVRAVPAKTFILLWFRAWQRYKILRIGLPLFVGVVSLLGLAMFKINDDVSSLQVLPSVILSQETIISLTSNKSDQKWFMIYGDNSKETFKRLKAFIMKLNIAKKRGWLTNYHLIPFDSEQNQYSDTAFVRNLTITEDQANHRTGNVLEKLKMALMLSQIEQYAENSVNESWRLIWTTLADGRNGILIPVDGVNNSAALSALAEALPGVEWIDSKAVFNEIFTLYRMIITGLLFAALGVIAACMIAKLGLCHGVISLLPSILSLVSSLAMLAFTGHCLNIFSLLALVLVLGIGVNYTFFLSNAKNEPLSALFTITLAMMTTIFTLSVLIFSNSLTISSFGIVLCSGIFVAYLLSPMVMFKCKEKITIKFSI